jgi:hypothetical protein
MANTVGNPWAVMIHTNDTSITKPAMMSSIWLTFHAAFAGPRCAKL